MIEVGSTVKIVVEERLVIQGERFYNGVLIIPKNTLGKVINIEDTDSYSAQCTVNILFPPFSFNIIIREIHLEEVVIKKTKMEIINQ